MNGKVSIIVPIYKVESYLHKCIDSIINQTYKNLEIILVDDGSPDNCGTICDEYALNDNRIKVIHKKNGGLSDARNEGLKIASGEWISFVDSDDWLENDAIEYMILLANEQQSDLIIGGTHKINDNDNSVIQTYTIAEDYKIMNTKEAFYDFFINRWASWARLYKASIHKNLYFPVGEINEDEAIVFTLLEKCSKIIRTSKIVYNYRWREQSITTSSFNIKKLDWCKHCKLNLDFISKKYPDLIPFAQNRYISSIIWALNNMTCDTKKFANPIRKLRRELHENLRLLKYLPQKEKLRVYLLVYFYHLYSFIIKILGKNYT